MARVKINQEYRLLISDKLMDLGNLIAAVLILGQFVSDKEFSISLLVVGFILMITCYIISFISSR